MHFEEILYSISPDRRVTSRRVGKKMAASHFLVGAKSKAFRTRNVRKSSGTCEDWSRDRSHKLIGIEGAIISTLHFAILPKTSLVIGQFENGDFFCFSLLSTRKRRFREPETKFFFRTSGSRLRVDGRTETEAFEYGDVIHITIITHALF